MDLSKKLLLSSDDAVATWVGKVKTEHLLMLMNYHLSDEANACILRTMSFVDQKTFKDRMLKSKTIINDCSALLDKINKKYPEAMNKNAILFTDLVNSTEKIMLLGDNKYYNQVIVEHNNILSECILENNGRVIKTIGDAYLAVFFDSMMALLACISAHKRFQKINQKRKKDYKIQVRMAIHYGELNLKLSDKKFIDVYGASINYASRMVRYAGGGEIFISKNAIDSYEIIRKLIIDLYKKGNTKKSKSFKDILEPKIKTIYEISNKIKFPSAGFFSFKGFKGDQELYYAKY